MHEQKQLHGLVHHVFFWLKNPDSMTDRNELIRGIQSLSAIPEIQQLHIGTPAPVDKRPVIDDSWSVSEMVIFADTAAHNIYQQHPIHLAFIENYGHLWQKVVVYDAVMAGD